VPAQTSKAQVIETINATAHTYEGVPGLIRKYYGITPDGTSLVGIYLWESKAAADAFYTADWVAMVTKRWAALPPRRQEWETPMVVGKRRAAACRRRIEASKTCRQSDNGTAATPAAMCARKQAGHVTCTRPQAES